MAIEPPDPNKTWRYSATANPLKKAPQKRKPRKTKVNHFMRLPAELRNNIYELVLVDNTKPQQIRHSKRKDPALLRTCKQIRLEARAVYYCLNEFSLIVSVDNLELLNQWLQYIKLTCGTIRGNLCVRNCTLDDMGKLFPLVQIAYEGMDVQNVAPDYQSGSEMIILVQGLASIGPRARREKWDMKRVEIEFDNDMLAAVQADLFRAVTMEGRLVGEPVDETTRPTGIEHLDEQFFQAAREDSPEVNHEHGRRHASGWMVVN